MIDRKRLRELASGIARRTGCVEWRTGYSDGSGPEIVTVRGKALLKSNWGCSCCEGEATSDQLSLTEYAAAANPTVVLSLLDTIERYERALRHVEKFDPNCVGCTNSDIESHLEAVAREALNPKEGV